MSFSKKTQTPKFDPRTQVTLSEVLTEADISRQLGNPDWRKVFSRRIPRIAKQEHAEVLSFFSVSADERLLDIAWLQNSIGSPIVDVEPL